MKVLIKEFLTEKCLTSTWLAKKINISTVAMSNIVTGKNAPSLDNLVKIADALEVSLDELIDREDLQAQKHQVNLVLDEQEYILFCTALQEKIEQLKKLADLARSFEDSSKKESLDQDAELIAALLRKIQESPFCSMQKKPNEENDFCNQNMS